MFCSRIVCYAALGLGSFQIVLSPVAELLTSMELREFRSVTDRFERVDEDVC